MYRFIRLSALLCVGLLLGGCGNNVGRAVQQMVGTEIFFPETLEWAVEHSETIAQRVNGKWAIVAWYDLEACSECGLKKTLRWSDYLHELSVYDMDSVAVLLILHSKAAELPKEQIIADSAVSSALVYDMQNEFVQYNTLPKDELFRTFLVDPAGQIRLVGSPIGNEKMWKLYLSVIRGV